MCCMHNIFLLYTCMSGYVLMLQPSSHLRSSMAHHHFHDAFFFSTLGIFFISYSLRLLCSWEILVFILTASFSLVEYYPQSLIAFSTTGFNSIGLMILFFFILFYYTSVWLCVWSTQLFVMFFFLYDFCGVSWMGI